MNRVFVSHEPMKMEHSKAVPRYDLNPAKSYGELISLLEWTEPRRYSWKELIPIMRGRIADFSDDDYILPVGHTIAIGLAIALAAEANLGKVRVLDWDRKYHEYAVISLDLGADFLLPKV